MSKMINRTSANEIARTYFPHWWQDGKRERLMLDIHVALLAVRADTAAPSPAPAAVQPEDWNHIWWCWEPGCGARACPLPGYTTLDAFHQHQDAHHPQPVQLRLSDEELGISTLLGRTP